MLEWQSYTLFTRLSNHYADIEQTSSQANVKQASSKHRAIRAHVVHEVHVYFECICFDDCLMFA